MKPFAPFMDSIPDSGLFIIFCITSINLFKFKATKFNIFERVHQRVSLATGIRLPIIVSKTNVSLGDFLKKTDIPKRVEKGLWYAITTLL